MWRKFSPNLSPDHVIHKFKFKVKVEDKGLSNLNMFLQKRLCNFLSKDTNLNQFDPMVTDLWSFEYRRSGAF